MRFPVVLTATVLFLSAAAHQAEAAEFDSRGGFLFDDQAVLTESFETAAPPIEQGASKGEVVTHPEALDGTQVLEATLVDEGLPISLALPSVQGSYHLSFWIQQDCMGGAAVDYDGGKVGTVSQAFPTGRFTSDGWVEMRTAAFLVDGTEQGIDVRLYLSGYDASEGSTVFVDGVEVIPDGSFVEPTSCVGFDLAQACGPEQLCLEGICHDARGWFPPLPSDTQRDAFVDTWKKKVRETFGPYLPRRASMPEAILTLEAARGAGTAVEFWSRVAEAIRRLRDAHTYTRSTFQDSLPLQRPLNVCFFEGDADLSLAVWPSDPLYSDILVSHVGPEYNSDLNAGDRLVAVDGIHPIAWAKQLMSRSLWYWEADDPAQLANIAASLRSFIPRHARSMTVLRCDAAGGTCSATPEVILVSSLSLADPDDEELKLIGCDNRPSYHVAGGPEDHRFGDAMLDEALVLEGPLLESMAGEDLRGIAWNSLLGGWPGSRLDGELNTAVNRWQNARGVVQDHREGHGGTAVTANITVGFSRHRFTPMASLMRDRADDEGPIDQDAGRALFDKVKNYAGVTGGSNNARTDIPVALLLTWDVSASDFLAFMMKGGPNVRLFGPGPTMGAFGTFFQYSYWGALRWSIGAEDSISPEGITLSGRGVYPDQVVLPTQSDLLAGRDTLHEAALAWIRSELSP